MFNINELLALYNEHTSQSITDIDTFVDVCRGWADSIVQDLGDDPPIEFDEHVRLLTGLTVPQFDYVIDL